MKTTSPIKEIEYPYAHPKGKEIAELKDEINQHHKELKRAIEKKDGEAVCTEAKKIALKLMTLQGIIESPLL